MDYAVHGGLGTLRVGDYWMSAGPWAPYATSPTSGSKTGYRSRPTADKGGSNLTADFSGRSADLTAEIRPE